jgi:hypothetical protein
VIGYLKEKSSTWIAQNVGRKARNFLGHKLWSRGYFVSRTPEMADKLQLKLASPQSPISCPRILHNRLWRFRFKPPALLGVIDYHFQSRSKARPGHEILFQILALGHRNAAQRPTGSSLRPAFLSPPLAFSPSSFFQPFQLRPNAPGRGPHRGRIRRLPMPPATAPTQQHKRRFGTCCV